MNDPYHPTTEYLDAGECWRLMASQATGRIAAVIAGRIELFPINLAIIDETVVMRTAPGTMMSTLIAAPEVVVEADGSEYRERVPHVWSVLVRGHASRVDSVDEEEDLDEHGPQPWQAGVKNEFIRIRANEISGRRFPVTGDTRE
jgi:nitroimidazol reductase NimA-like FMN-containing flavoprotein (pyridoxamine 5'-phosphate oxidase superfamily)